MNYHLLLMLIAATSSLHAAEFAGKISNVQRNIDGYGAVYYYADIKDLGRVTCESGRLDLHVSVGGYINYFQPVKVSSYAVLIQLIEEQYGHEQADTTKREPETQTDSSE